MSEELKVVVDSVKELHTLVESKIDANSAEYKEKMDKITTDLDAQEVKNQELVKSLSEKEKEATELKERMDEFEKKLTKPGLSGKALDNEKKSFELFVTKGANAEGLEKKYLRTDVNTEGGYLAPSEYVTDIIKGINEISNMRSVARVRTTSKGQITIPKRTSLFAAQWVGEGGNTPNVNGNYGEIVVPVNKLVAPVVITTEMLTDSAFNMESEILSDASEAFAMAEGAGFISGNGVKKPEGFMANASVASTNSGSATDITADNMITLSGELKTGYNPVYVLNRTTLAAIRKMKTSSGDYVWQSGLAAGQPNTINGYRYVEMNDMDSIGAGLFPVAFGDFNRGYTIVDHTDISVLRDVFTLSGDGKVKFVFTKRTGGQVVLAEAIKKLKVSV